MSGQTGAANGRAGGHASGSARRKRALDRAPRVRVLSETPTTKRKRHQDAVETSEQDLSPPGVDTGLLTSVTTTVVMSIIDDMQLSPQSKRQCTVLMSTAAASVGAAMWQLGANWARKPQNVFAGRRAPKSVKTTKKTLSGRRVHFATRSPFFFRRSQR